MLLLLQLAFLYLVYSEVCQIDVPIGTWLKNNRNRNCEIVKGHFILNNSATPQVEKIYESFEGLKRIEGCIYVKNYTGSRNLSFFSSLEDVICDKTAATASNLKDVIHVHEPYLYTMGFHSLKNVTGPGEIYLSFEDNQETYMNIYNDMERYDTEGRECFSKKEMIFLARHPQFIGKMYRACETEDPCFRPELFNEFYTIEDIPDACTTFAGMICIMGPYPDDLPVFQKFRNLTLLIGELQVGMNLFDSLDIFSNLEVVYPYMTGPIWHNCYDSGFDLAVTHNKQPIAVGLGRFMKSISLPSLQPIRPLEISQPFSKRYIAVLSFSYTLFLSEEKPNPCAEFPQFPKKKCSIGYQYNELIGGGLERTYSFANEAWIIGTVFIGIGLLFVKRCLISLYTRQLKDCLPKSQYLIATVILIMALTAVESVIINQRAYGTTQTKDNEYCLFAVFSSTLFLHPSIQLLIKLLAASRQTCPIVLIFCYPDIILYYGWKRWTSRLSQLYVIFASILSFLAFLYFHSQLVTDARPVMPHYVDKQGFFMIFVMNADGYRNYSIWVADRASIPVSDGFIQFMHTAEFKGDEFIGNYIGPNDMQLEILGERDIMAGTLAYHRSLLWLLVTTEGYWDYQDEEMMWAILRIVEKLPCFTLMVVSFL